MPPEYLVFVGFLSGLGLGEVFISPSPRLASQRASGSIVRKDFRSSRLIERLCPIDAILSCVRTRKDPGFLTTGNEPVMSPRPHSISWGNVDLMKRPQFSQPLGKQ
ncbi:hypothetical protein PtA15_9A66 [Puccinia triticina]|uniref:Secreted protein n=1 Tax=Puccinia triticina TaxID=208348 RepID=A0ABY7CZ02_9BASI|nr:uncharacterized protein PtA15_9A66 [Puccinia triticina]WAQ87942.1 hypothetical protein PtA15_9A66 [Puccinia triticina]